MLSKDKKIALGATAYKSGYTAETLACILLRLKGYHIIARNLRFGKGTNRGEIDIIAGKHNLLAFIEVKKRQNYMLSSEAVNIQNKRRVTLAAEAFLAENPIFNNYDIRFDVFLFNRYLMPKHIKDAWRQNWW